MSSGGKVHHIKEGFNKALVLNPKKRVKNFDMTVVEELSVEETPRILLNKKETQKLELDSSIFNKES